MLDAIKAEPDAAAAVLEQHAPDCGVVPAHDVVIAGVALRDFRDHAEADRILGPHLSRAPLPIDVMSPAMIALVFSLIALPVEYPIGGSVIPVGNNRLYGAVLDGLQSPRALFPRTPE